MEYGNMGNTGGAEFNWSYSMGGNSGGGGQSMPIYPQMGQMGSDYSGGGGQQWLHSNQANAQNFQPSMPQGQAAASPFDDYNQSMMRYTNIPKMDGGSMGQQQGAQSMGMNAMGNNYGGYPGSMTRNGLGNPGAGMGQGANSGYGGNW